MSFPVVWLLTAAFLVGTPPGQPAGAATGTPESESASQRGLNDSPATADDTGGFGTGAGDDPELDVTGALPGSLLSVPNEAGAPGTSLDGSIGTATATGLTPGGSIFAVATIGESGHPYGNSGSGTGDYDWFSISGVTPGQTIRVEVTTLLALGDLDPVVAVYDAAGTRVAANDDGDPRGADSVLDYTAASSGTHYVVVRGFGSGWQNDPADPASGQGAGANSQGIYALSVAYNAVIDRDVFAVDLEAGDVLGAALDGANLVTILDAAGAIVIDSISPTASERPVASPLPTGTFSDVAFVAPATGTYHVQVRAGVGSYTLRLRAFRPFLSPSPTTPRRPSFWTSTGPRWTPPTPGGRVPSRSRRRRSAPSCPVGVWVPTTRTPSSTRSWPPSSRTSGPTLSWMVATATAAHRTRPATSP
ncbi:MAG TPA: PPC domain-containing protein [Nitriliruptorales bacterium]